MTTVREMNIGELAAFPVSTKILLSPTIRCGTLSST